MSPETTFMILGHPPEDILFEFLITIIQTIIFAGVIGYFFVRPFKQRQLLRLHRQIILSQRNETHVSFSINYFAPNTDNRLLLKIRPIGRGWSIDELFPNRFVRETFLQAARRCNSAHPILTFPKGDVEIGILSVLQSEASDDFTLGFLMEATNHPVQIHRFALFAVFEQYEDVPVRKVRIILTPVDLLHNMPEPRHVRYEKPHHRRRYQTMLLMSEHYRAMPEAEQLNNTIELAFPLEKTYQFN